MRLTSVMLILLFLSSGATLGNDAGRKEPSCVLSTVSNSLPAPLKRLAFHPSPEKLLADARKLVSDQEQRFDRLFSTTGFRDEASLRSTLKAMGGDYAKLLNALDHGEYEFAMNSPEEAREWIPKTGFLNQHETGNSRGTMDPTFRDKLEAELTGNKYSDYSAFDNKLKPKYGYLKPTPRFGLKQSATTQSYGTDVYIFKKDRVKERITWTAGDSFGDEGYTGRDPENPVPHTWQSFFVPWKDRSLIVPFIHPSIEKKRMGFEAGYDFAEAMGILRPPAPAEPSLRAPSRAGIPLKPTEPMPPILPAPEPELTPYLDTVLSSRPSTLPPPISTPLLSSAPPSAVEAYKKWQAETKAAMATPEYKQYEAALAAYHASDAYKAWSAAEHAYATSPAVKNYKTAMANYNKAMSEYFNSEAFVAYSKALRENLTISQLKGLKTLLKGTPLEPLKFRDDTRGYIEIQYFGPVTLDDVEVFEFRENPPTGEFLEELKKRNIKIRDGRKEPAVDWTEDIQSILDQMTLGKGLKWELLKSADKKEAETVFNLYQKTYSDFGMVIPNAEKLAQSRNIAIIRDETGKIASYMLGRQDQFGFLVTQIGADSTRQGIQALSQTLKSYIPEGMYFQTSGHPLSAFKKSGQAPIVPFEVVQKIRQAQGRLIRRPTESELKHEVEKGHLPNDPEVLKNAYYTTVVMDGKVKSVIKVMMGKPNLKEITQPKTARVPE